MEHRKTEQIIILGHNGTGKSTLVGELIKKAASVGRRSLIITPDPVEWSEVEEMNAKASDIRNFTGIRKIVFESEKETLPPLRYYNNGILIFDDCRAYFPAQVHPDLKYLFIRRRQLMLDLVLVGHGFTDIPPKYYTNSSKYILFKTVDNITSRKPVLARFEELKNAQARINKKALKNPYYKEVIDI